MKIFNNNINSKLIDYVIPCILIIIALLASYYIINTTRIIENNFIANLEKKFKRSNLETSNSKADTNIGLSKSIEGYYYLNTASGKKVFIPTPIQRYCSKCTYRISCFT